MKPENINPPFLLSDNAPVRCVFMAQTDPPRCHEECETDATVSLSPLSPLVLGFRRWIEQHPKAIISLRPTGANEAVYLCDTHHAVIQESQA